MRLVEVQINYPKPKLQILRRKKKHQRSQKKPFYHTIGCKINIFISVQGKSKLSHAKDFYQKNKRGKQY